MKQYPLPSRTSKRYGQLPLKDSHATPPLRSLATYRLHTCQQRVFSPTPEPPSSSLTSHINDTHRYTYAHTYIHT